MPRTPTPTTALYVRLPAADADKLDRAARASGIAKNALVSRLVSALDDPDGGRPADGEAGTRRITADPAGDAMAVGSYAFTGYDLPEVLTAEQAGQLLQLAESVVVELAEAGRLPGRLLGGAWRFSRTGLVTWLSQDATTTDSAAAPSP